MTKSSIPRRQIGRELTHIVNAPVSEVLSQIGDAAPQATRRVGVTGPPGAGKSTLISALAGLRLRREEMGTLAVLAIDPSSPLTGGSILGDRIRMDAIADEPNLFIRSIPSRGARNGLCDNIVDLLAALERYGFEETILETVGVGQSDIEVRELVDTMVLVAPPEGGDVVQAMKAGVIELADIFVVSKAEDPRSRRMVSELRAVVGATRPRPHGWMPQVIPTDAAGEGVPELCETIDRHQRLLRERRDLQEIRRSRRRYHLKALALRQIETLLEGDDAIAEDDLESSYAKLLSRLRA